MDTFSPNNRNSIKGAAIKKAGFLTGIHALPLEVKNKLDELLLRRYAPERALSILEREYPNANLPSKSAVYTYKSKYLPASMTNSRQVSLNVEKLDIEKMNVASLYVSHLKRFIAIDLNVLQDRWYKNLEKEQDTGVTQKATNELGKMYMEGIKLGMDMLLKLNVSIDTQEKQEDDNTESKGWNLTDLQRRKVFIIVAQSAYERRENGEQLDDLDAAYARFFERRGKIELASIAAREQYEAEQKEKDTPQITQLAV